MRGNFQKENYYLNLCTGEIVEEFETAVFWYKVEKQSVAVYIHGIPKAIWNRVTNMMTKYTEELAKELRYADLSEQRGILKCLK